MHQKIKTIIFISGAYHSSWCWEENFVSYYKRKGYEVFTIDPSIGNGTTKGFVSHLRKLVSKLHGSFAFIAHSMGNLLINEYLEYGGRIPDAAVMLSPYPVNQRFKNVFKVFKLYNFQNKDSLFFSGRVKNSNKYLGLLNTESASIKSLTLRFKKPEYKRYNIPTLVIGSDNDRCIPVDSFRLTGKYYGASIVMFDDICHDSMLDPNWREVASCIECFIDSIY